MTHSKIFYIVLFMVLVTVACGRTQVDFTEPVAPVIAPKAEQASVFSVPAPKPDTAPATDVQVTPAPLPVAANDSSRESAEASTNTRNTTEYGSGFRRYYGGEATLEERIAVADVIAIARMASVTAGVEEFEPYTSVGEATTRQEFVGALRFTFNVSTYLKNDKTSTSTELTAVVNSWHYMLTRAEAQTVADQMLADRDTQWDDRDAVIFLVRKHNKLPVTNSDNIFYMSLIDVFDLNRGDQYSIASKRNKIWLPEAEQSVTRTSSTAEKWFLTDVPTSETGQASRVSSSTQSGRETPSIAQSKLVQEINRVTAEMNAEPQSGYAMCIAYGYLFNREEAWAASQGKDLRSGYSLEREIGSGLPTGTSFRKIDQFIVNANWKSRTWFEGDDVGLFVMGDIVRTWESIIYYYRNSFDAAGGKFLVKGTLHRHNVETARPLPRGEYALVENNYSIISEPCEHYKEVINWTVTVTAPSGTLHEAFFDPVTDGTAVAADSSNGQLEPAAFTDANGASATVQRIEWASTSTGSGQAGTVKVKVSPHTGLAGHKLDFIELDGAVSLSLLVDDATVDAANRTLSWTVTPRPWEDGDKLMLRIAELVTEVTLVNVPASITQGQSASVTVRATDLPSSNSYTVRLAANSFAIGFNNNCLYGSKTVVVPSGSASHSATIPLQGCDATSSTVTATLMQGTSTVATATAKVEVEASSNVTVTLSPREERHGTYTNMTAQWNDPSGCVGRYYVGIFNSQQTVVNNLGYHPAPATTSLSQNLGRSWDDIPNLDWFVKVRCHSSSSRMTIVGQASLQSGLPSTP